MSVNWKTWSPFQSEDVRMICAHLSESEETALACRGGFYGIWVAATFAIPLTAAISRPNTYTFIIAAVLIPIHLVCIPFWQKRQRTFLCQTAWARERGLTPDKLKLFSIGRRNAAEPEN